MGHRTKGRKLGTDAAPAKAMKKSLTAALLANDRIKTTATRAKEIRPYVDRIITWAKRGDVHSRRLAIAKVGDKEIVREIFEKVEQGMFAGRNGGYTRIYRLGNRKGDNAPMVIMELVTEPVSGAAPTATEKKAEKPLRGKKAQEKAEEDLVAKFKFDDDDEDAEASEETAAEEVVDEAESETEEANDEAEEAAAAESEADETVATEETEETVTDEADAPAAEADEATEEPASEDSEEK